MTDREKVIKGLEAHEKGCGYRSHNCDAMGCPYRYGDESCDIAEMCHDAIALLKEQGKKEIKLHKRHVITLERNAFTMGDLYEAICETLMDEGELVILSNEGHEKVNFAFYVTHEDT